MSRNICGVFQNLRNEDITETSHLEKLCLFRSGVGRDNVSDFTCNLIKDYLLQYTETFAHQYLAPSQCREISVEKVYFDYEHETWRPKTFYLPYFNGDFVLLTPKDILTKDENWINFGDMRQRFLSVITSLPNEELQDQINDVYRRAIPKRATQKDINTAVSATVNRYPQLLDYYIKIKEEDKDEAKDVSTNIVSEADRMLSMSEQMILIRV